MFVVLYWLGCVRNNLKQRVSTLGSAGQATAEYAVVILIAVALGLAVLALFTGGAFNTMLETLVRHVLQAAVEKIQF